MSEDVWLDEAAGPVVRPYAMTGGRTRPTAQGLDLAAFVLAVGSPPAPSPRWFPEHFTVLELCRSPLSVAEVASRLNFSVGVTRVLLSDLAEEHLVMVREPASHVQRVDEGLLKEVMDGLEAL